jgi:hypothetical protein
MTFHMIGEMNDRGPQHGCTSQFSTARPITSRYAAPSSPIVVGGPVGGGGGGAARFACRYKWLMVHDDDFMN